MFTGIVEQTGTVRRTGTANGFLWATLEPEQMWADVVVGESIAVSGVCLTVASRTDTNFTVELSQETLAKTAENWQPGAMVNFERALRLADRLGGHVVSGHVDGVGTVLAVNEAPGAVTVDVEAPLELARYLVPKGSVTVDGVSLTVVKVGGPAGNVPDLAANRFQLWLVPHTLAVTSLGRWHPGTKVNLEADAAPTRADPRLLEQALNNLVANALRHTPKGEVMLRSGVTEAGAYIEVGDVGPGLPDLVREGLGLRVIRSVADAHNGTLTFDYEHGTRVRLLLPG